MDVYGCASSPAHEFTSRATHSSSMLLSEMLPSVSCTILFLPAPSGLLSSYSWLEDAIRYKVKHRLFSKMLKYKSTDLGTGEVHWVCIHRKTSISRNTYPSIDGHRHTPSGDRVMMLAWPEQLGWIQFHTYWMHWRYHSYLQSRDTVPWVCYEGDASTCVLLQVGWWIWNSVNIPLLWWQFHEYANMCTWHICVMITP